MAASGQHRAKTKSKAVAQPRRVKASSARAGGQRPALPPKLTAPRPTRIFPRTRLFDLLDRTRKDHRVIWVSAPGGAGKTSLATSYLSTRKLPVLWYQVDAGDGDIASFFYYMGLAARQAAPRHKHPLPHLTPEYLADVPTFTRNFFRELYRRLPRNSVIVLDNYQDAPEDSLLHDVLHTAMGEVPEGLNLLVLSRVEPPAVLARLRLCDHAACLDWGKIQLTPEETRGIGALRLGKDLLDANLLDTLHQRTQGWAAGVVLMLEQGRSDATLDAATLPAGQKLLFDYFATEILVKMEEETKNALLASALLPKMTANMVAQLAAFPEAGRLLAELSRKNYFTLKHPGAEPAYEYHPLFREFLLASAKANYTPEQFLAMKKTAAALLEGDSQIEAAAALWQESADWSGITHLSLKYAQSLISQGRSHTLEAWLKSLPSELLAQTPWLLYWLGVCRLPYNPPEARRYFENAFMLFNHGEDVAGLFLSWSGAVDTLIYEWGDVRPLGRWIDVLPGLLVRYPVILSGDIGTRVTIGMFCALVYCQPAHPDLPIWEARAWDVAFNSPDITTRVTVGHHLLFYHSWWSGDKGKASQLVDMLRQSVEHEKATPLALIVWYAIEATYQWKMPASQEACLAAVRRGLEVAESSGIHMFDTLLYAQGAWGALTFGDLDLAREFLRKEQATLNPMRQADICQYHMQAYVETSLRGELALAAEHAKTSFLAGQATGAPFGIAVVHRVMGFSLYEQGAREKAFFHLARTREMAEEMRSDMLKYSVYKAYAEIELMDPAPGTDLPALRRLMALGAQHGYLNETFWNSATMARLCATALEHHIEPDYVRTLIRKRRLPPPEGSVPESWPYPIKLHTLGRFTVLVDDKPLSRSPAHKKPLDLLQALVALGGREVDEDNLAETLWPETEGDAARLNLKVNVHRLRQLLPKGAIVWSEGKLSLDARQWWVDLWALERELGRLDQSPQADAQEPDSSARRILSLYQGEFLSPNTAPWALAARERLRNKTLRLVARAAESLGRRDPTAAIPVYEKAIELDPLRETLYLELMRCHQRLQQPAEGLRIYRRCRDTLKRELGVSPSSATETLQQALKTGA